MSKAQNSDGVLNRCDHGLDAPVLVNYQACNDVTWQLSETEILALEVPLTVTVASALHVHMGHGQREGRFAARDHLQRLTKRKKAAGTNL